MQVGRQLGKNIQIIIIVKFVVRNRGCGPLYLLSNPSLLFLMHYLHMEQQYNQYFDLCMLESRHEPFVVLYRLLFENTLLLLYICPHSSSLLPENIL